MHNSPPDETHRDGPHVVIVGGGFAGVSLARALERRLPPSWNIVLLSQENYITYNPLLAEVVGASILPGHVVAPIRQMIRRTDFRMVNVTDIDFERREVNYLGEGVGHVRFDQLILACGVRANLDLVPGMARYALPLKTVGDALFLRNRVMVRVEQAELQPDPEARRWLTRFIIIGGGFSGVEVAGEINDFLRASGRYYPCVARDDFRVSLLHSGDHLMQEVAPRLGAFAAAKMRDAGVDVHLNTRVARVDDRGVVLADGERIDGGTVVCTIGTAPHDFVGALPLPKQRGRIETCPDMSVPGFTGVWALGDCAWVPNARDGKTCPPTAQCAVRQAHQLARNIIAAVAAQGTRPCRYRAVGQLSTIGHNKAVAEMFGIKLSGFIAWLLWRGVYLLKIPTLARKVRIFFEWNWGMLFPPDIAHLRFNRTPRPTPRTANSGRDG